MAEAKYCRYVLGFCFDDDCEKVLLIEKRRPAWQAGRLNGIGGKIEAGETPAQAMVREFAEETGDTVPGSLDWRPFARLCGGGWEVWVFYAKMEGWIPRSLDGVDVGEGVTRIVTISKLNLSPTLPGLRYLIPMACNHLSKADRAPFFQIFESSVPPELDEAKGEPAQKGGGICGKPATQVIHDERERYKELRQAWLDLGGYEDPLNPDEELQLGLAIELAEHAVAMDRKRRASAVRKIRARRQ
jgi:hypothetical protein